MADPRSLARDQQLADAIESIAESLLSPSVQPGDLHEGLATIAGRAQAVSRFMQAYSRLARLPMPRLADLPVGTLVRRVIALETRLRVQLDGGPEVTIRADRDQLDQLLIDILANAVEATVESRGDEVRLAWSVSGGTARAGGHRLGPGLPPSANLFTPFFTTKKAGSGIGLVLSRQIRGEPWRRVDPREPVRRPGRGRADPFAGGLIVRPVAKDHLQAAAIGRGGLSPRHG